MNEVQKQRGKLLRKVTAGEMLPNRTFYIKDKNGYHHYRYSDFDLHTWRITKIQQADGTFTNLVDEMRLLITTMCKDGKIFTRKDLPYTALPFTLMPEHPLYDKNEPNKLHC